jgi:hypothetical protein
MNMLKFIPIIFSISILLALILSSACVTQSSPNQTTPANPNDIGITQISGSADSMYIGFDAALQDLLTYNPYSINGSTPVKTIYSIHGTDVNESGYAASWIFGVSIANVNEFLAYEQGGRTIIPLNTPLDSEEIDVERIVSPDRLFSQNSAMILGNLSHAITERRDIDLKDGIYTLTITSNSSVRVLAFNATTGELIP